MGDLQKCLVGWSAGFLLGVIGLPTQGAVHVVLVDHGQPQFGNDVFPDTRGIVLRLVSDEGPILAVDFATRTGPTYDEGFGFFGRLVQRGIDPTGNYAYFFESPGTTTPGPEPADNLSPSVGNLDSHFLPIPGAVFMSDPAEGNANFAPLGPGWPDSNGFNGYGLGDGWTDPPTNSGFLIGAMDLSAQPSSNVELAYVSVWGFYGNWTVGPVTYRGSVLTPEGWTLVEGAIRYSTIPEPSFLGSGLGAVLLLGHRICKSRSR